MVWFIIDMGKELKTAKSQGTKLCKHLEGVHDFKPTKENKARKIEEGKMIFNEIIHSETSFHYDKGTQEFMFNAQSVSREVGWMA